MKDGHIADTDGCLWILTLHQDYSYENDDKAQLVSCCSKPDEVKNNIESGMSLMYTGDKEEIDGDEYLIFALEPTMKILSNQKYFAWCFETRIYVYDVIDDKWIVLGEG